MTSTPPPPEAPSAPEPTGPSDGPRGSGASGGPGGPRVSMEQMKDLGRLRRSTSDRRIAGVAGGLARHFDIDPTIIRVAFVVLALFGGAGLLLYGVCWLLVPEDGEATAKIDLEPSVRGIVLIAFGVVAALMMVGDSWGVVGFPWPLAVIGIVVLGVMLSRRKREERDQQVRPGSGEASAQVPGAAPGSPERSAGASWSTGVPQEYVGWVADEASYSPAAPPRRRGPGLFWPTAAAIAVALGVIGLLELSGVAVADGVYPAVALAISGLALVVGAWFGRAGGVIFLGVLALGALGVSQVVENGVAATVTEHPTTAALVKTDYKLGFGELVLDLRDVGNIDALDGRTISLDTTVGAIEVIVPEDIDVTARADISGGGSIDLFGSNADGDSPQLSRTHDGGVDVPHLTIDAEANFGAITVRTP